MEHAEVETDVPKPKKKKIVRRIVKRPKNREDESHEKLHSTSEMVTEEEKTLPALSSACATVVADTGQEIDTFSAFEIEWDEC